MLGVSRCSLASENTGYPNPGTVRFFPIDYARLLHCRAGGADRIEIEQDVVGLLIFTRSASSSGPN